MGDALKRLLHAAAVVASSLSHAPAAVHLLGDGGQVEVR
jgi:hypothetical protein